MADYIDEMVRSFGGTFKNNETSENQPKVADEGTKNDKPFNPAEKAIEETVIPDNLWLDVTLPIKQDIFLLRQNGIGFFPLGDIQGLRGMEGNGKSFCLTMFMAAVLKGEYGTLTTDIPNATVLYIDTEQHLNNVLLTSRRVQYMCGWPLGQPNKRFVIMTLREVDDIDSVQVYVQKAMLQLSPTATFIDGLVDTIKSKNDEPTSRAWVRKLMKFASEQNMAIPCVQHVNYGSDKMSGHLGTELAHKASDVLACQKIKDKVTGDVYFKVEQVKARNRDIEDISFKIIDVSDGQGGKIGIPEIIQQRNPDVDTPTNRGERDDLMREIFMGGKSLSRTAVINAIVVKRFISGNEQAKQHAKLWFEQAEQWGIIQYNAHAKQYKYVGLKEDPFEQQEQEQSLDFDS